MNPEDGPAIARDVLDRFEAALAARDDAALDDLTVDGAVLFGTTQAHLETSEVRRYVRQVAREGAVTWTIDQWAVLHHDASRLLVAGVGQVQNDDGTSAQSWDFRLTLGLVHDGDTWRVQHFHGSTPGS